jgi:predicted nuclease of predicted toxin-antitoxin system
MKFLADMGISPRTVAWLRQQGYDAAHLSEQGLERLSDEAILTKARNEGRIVLTLDLDFSYLLAISQAQIPSVVLFRLGDTSYLEVTDRLNAVLKQCAPDLEAGAIISVRDNAIRVRKLPI